ncbi:MAG: zinc-binding dehydrogenase [Bacteroidota bacterium]
MQEKIPKKMKAVVLYNYNPNMVKAIKSLEVEEILTPKPKKNQVLIKVDASPCNPSDLSFIQGSYGIKKKVPIVPGFEGTGIVVQAANDKASLSLLDKRVSFNAHVELNGAWAEYAVTNTSQCIPVHPEIPVEQAACLLVNPYTAYAMFDLIKERKSKAFVMNAAMGQLAGMMRNMADEAEIEVINMVRKNGQIDTLKKKGAKNVLCTTDENFQDQFKDLVTQLEAKTFIDAVSGELSGKMLELMPSGSQLIVYGALTGENLSQIGAKDLIFYGKSVTGFNLIQWFETTPKQKIMEITAKLQEKILKGKIKTEIYKKVKLGEVKGNILRYLINMSVGKVIIEP